LSALKYKYIVSYRIVSSDDLGRVSMPNIYISDHLLQRLLYRHTDNQTNCSTWTTIVVCRNWREWRLIAGEWSLGGDFSSVCASASIDRWQFAQLRYRIFKLCCVLCTRRKASRVSWSFWSVNWQLPANRLPQITTASRQSRLFSVGIYYWPAYT